MQRLTYGPCTTGRVKTLHPGVHGGILAMRNNQAHMDAIGKHNIDPIDIVSGLHRLLYLLTSCHRPAHTFQRARLPARLLRAARWRPLLCKSRGGT